MSAALLSTPFMHSAVEDDLDVSVDVVSSIGHIILSLLFCRSGFLPISYAFEYAVAVSQIVDHVIKICAHSLIPVVGRVL